MNKKTSKYKKEFVQKRLNFLLGQSKNLDAILVSSVSDITYLSENFRFSDTEREAFLLFTKNQNYFITDKRYSEAVSKKIQDFILINSGAHLFLKKEAKEIFEKNKIKSLGIEVNNVTVYEHLLLRKFTKVKPFDLSNLRIIKQRNEIRNIKKACRIGDKTFEHILKQLKTGIREKEIEDAIESFIKKRNADISFKPVVAFGKNSSVPHHHSGQTKLTKNMIVLLDFGVKVNNYCSDMTRTVFFGTASEKFRKIYQTVLEAQKKSIDHAKSSLQKRKIIKGRNLDNKARGYIIAKGFPTIPHSVGHGIGIEVHESPHLSPNSKDIIKPGMVFSIEPGIYIPNFGGVRIEDLFFIDNNRIEVLTHSTKQLIEL
ncbi:MAG: aminopeptidase P family protein [Candidatus Levybacteria bacterium]|nr:aminopeptidase P family protein [Candidatus Levybacteria bacterium]